MTGQRLLVAATVVACVGAASVGGFVAVRTGSTSSAAAPAQVVDLNAGLGASTTMARPVEANDQTTGAAAQALARTPKAASPSTARPQASTASETSAPAVVEPQQVPTASPVSTERPSPAVAPSEVAEAQAVVEEFEVPEDAVVGIRLDTEVSSETSAIEDRVSGRVTRAVTIGNRTVIPAGAELVGYVSAVERGGKVRERARIGINFTSVIINKVRTPIQTETIYRLGESPRGEAAAKIGGSAVVGTIIGGMIGGKKGAAIGGTAGAAGGTAVVMKGDRNQAAFAAGTSLTVRLAAPVKIRVER